MGEKEASEAAGASRAVDQAQDTESARSTCPSHGSVNW